MISVEAVILLVFGIVVLWGLLKLLRLSLHIAHILLIPVLVSLGLELLLNPNLLGALLPALPWLGGFLAPVLWIGFIRIVARAFTLWHTITVGIAASVISYLLLLGAQRLLPWLPGFF